ncbi:MAG: hypothetical protein JO189_13365 [Deltaproteobacteria bacterium]|nr:hypothetical protein [Deltaproteobacteria bacterium]
MMRWPMAASALGNTDAMELPFAINQRWSLGFVSNRVAGGFSRECLTIVGGCPLVTQSLGALAPREFADQQGGQST